MAFKLRVGAINMPQAGDTIRVYYTGTTNLVSPIFTPDSVGATLSNPFTCPSTGFYGFEPSTNDRVDIWWDEGVRYIAEDVNVKDVYLDDGNPLPQYILNGEQVDYYDFNLGLTEDPVVRNGRLFWDDKYKTLSMMSNNSIMQVGQELWVRGKNNTGSTIPNGTPVSINGSLGNEILIVPTNSQDTTLAKKFIGLTTESIVDGAVGFVTISGVVRSVNTSGFSTEGVKLWINPNVVGGLTETEPIGATGYKIHVGYVKYKHSSQGEIYIESEKILKLKDLSEILDGDDLVIKSDDDLQLTALGDKVVLDAQGTNGFVQSLKPFNLPTYSQSTLPNPALYQKGTCIWYEDENQIYISTGASWVPASDSGFFRDEYIVGVGGQATFSTSKEYALNTDSILIYVNGVLQESNKYTELDGFTIVFNTPVEAGKSVSLTGIADAYLPDLGTAAGANIEDFEPAGSVSGVTTTINNHVGSTGSAHGVVTTSVNGFMSTNDKSKLDGVAINANNYTHPATHPPSIIVQDSSNRFVSDTEKSTWNAKASTSTATTSVNGLMSSTDKSKLDGVATNATANTGTVTSVAATAGTGITISGSPITTTGTLTITNSAPHVATNLTATAGTTAGPTIVSSTGTSVVIPSASATASGVVTTTTQTFAGVKTFSSTITGSISGSSGSCTGNAASATTAATLTTARDINGTSFNGSAAITTASWGTARTITIGGTGKSVDGSGAVSWTVAEILGTSLTLTGDITAANFYTSSKRDVKKEIEELKVDAINLIKDTEIVTFRYKENDEELRVGFIADDTNELMSGEEHDKFDIPNTVGVLIKAVQQLIERVEALEVKYVL